MDVDLTRLRYFVAVAEELHFARAAERLRISPPPLSRQIRLLEAQVGGALFTRRYHRVELTELGRTLLPEARAVLVGVERFRIAAARAAGAPAPLRVAVTAYAPSDFLGAFQAAVLDHDPAAIVDVAGSAAEVKARVLAGGADLGLVHLPVMDARLAKRAVATYPTALALPASDELAGRAVVRIEDVVDREILVDFARPNPELLAWSIRRLHEVGLTRLVHSVTTKGEVELAHYAASRGIAVMVPYAPDSVVGRIFAAPQFAVVPFDPESYPPARLAVAWLPDAAERDPRIAAAVDAVAAALDAGVPAG